MTPLLDPLVSDAARESFRALVVGLFGFRRKQILRALREFTGWSPERAADVLSRTGILVTVRPEVLSPAEFVRLHRAIVDGGWTMR
jgi:16S rRNA A1518/A1519 N6-dimethyltransferase RsmA/KsgA/DIM1 with predicted DNA glycosylase/AP lyase activity